MPDQLPSDFWDSLRLGEVESERWAPVLALRLALRILPIAVVPIPSRGSMATFRTAALLRATILTKEGDESSVSLTQLEGALEQSLADMRFKGSRANPRSRAISAIAAAANTLVPREAISISAFDTFVAACSAVASSKWKDLCENVAMDVKALRGGMTPATLLSISLWRVEPTWASNIYFKAKDELEDANWMSWAAWYDILWWGVDSDVLGPLESAVALAPTSLWRRSIADATEYLNRFNPDGERKSPPSTPESAVPDVPPNKPAAIEPVFLPDGRLGLPSGPARSDLNEAGIKAAFAAIRDGFDELAQDAEEAGNIDKRSIRELRRISDRIPTEVPAQDELFRLGHVQALLDGYAAIVNDEWPRLLASKYHAINRLFEDTIRQFPEWREFKRNAAQDQLTNEQMSAGAGAGDLLAEDLQTPARSHLLHPICLRPFATWQNF